MNQTDKNPHETQNSNSQTQSYNTQNDTMLQILNTKDDDKFKVEGRVTEVQEDLEESQRFTSSHQKKSTIFTNPDMDDIIHDNSVI